MTTTVPTLDLALLIGIVVIGIVLFGSEAILEKTEYRSRYPYISVVLAACAGIGTVVWMLNNI